MTLLAKRLIEVDLPIRQISVHARREKSVRHGHISTLHLWWARRPLAACRAVICAALWPDPVDQYCPPAFRSAAVRIIVQFAENVRSDATLAELCQTGWSRWNRTNAATFSHDDVAAWTDLRYALLDFIADFANWDASAVPGFLKAAQALTQAAHEALGGAPGTRPLLIDPFAGGGAIPLEALRVGADAFASDLNPVAVLLNKVMLEYIPQYRDRLAAEVRSWGGWISEKTAGELGEFYPSDPDGATPIAYIWARTILSEAPDQGDTAVEVPLLRSLWLAKRSGRNRALRWVRDDAGEVQTQTLDVTYADGATIRVRRPILEIFEPASERDVEPGTVARGAATCPVTGFTTPLVRVKAQLQRRHGGAADARLLCVAVLPMGQQVRAFRLPNERDLQAVRRASVALRERQQLANNREYSIVPDESTVQYDAFVNRGPLYGMTTWADYFTPRQALTLVTLSRLAAEAGMRAQEQHPNGLGLATQTVLGLAVSRFVDICNSLCRWENTKTQVRNVFTRQAIPMLWDFAEPNVLADAAGNYDVTLSTMARVLDTAFSTPAVGQVIQADACAHPLPDDSANAFVTDPPYYYSVQYADLSDFFYVWLRRALSDAYPELLSLPATPKDDEIIVQSPSHQFVRDGKNNAFYESHMKIALEEGRRVLAPSGIATVVFAHTSTAGWEALLQALVDAGWVVTGSWPIDTELANRMLAQNRSVLASSVHIVCRPRETPDGALRDEDVGDWRDVLAELPVRIHEWMPRLAAEGVVGADAIFACIGPALEVFSRYTRVEKASGEVVKLGEYLEQVWAAVSREALNMIFSGADASGFEADARLTAIWLWTLSTGASNGIAAPADGEVAGDGDDDEDLGAARATTGGFSLEYDAARKIAQGLGAHLDRLTSVIEVKGDTARLLSAAERTRHLFGKDEAQPTMARGTKRKAQLDMFAELAQAEDETTWGISGAPPPGATTLDRVHQAMILFGSGRAEALRRFLVEQGVGTDQAFWRLAQALSALYPAGTDEKRWVDGVLARKRGLGL